MPQLPEITLESPPLKPAAQALLLETYFEKRLLLVRYFVRLTGDSALAEDIIQELFLKVSDMKTEPHIGDPTAFLFRMAHNLHLNQLRSLNNSRGRDTAWHDISGHRMGGESVDDAPSVEDQLDGRQRMTKVMTALGELPEKTQSIFRLHKFDGLSQTEVAARLDVSLSTVEKHLGTALRHLMARLRMRSGSAGDAGP